MDYTTDTDTITKAFLQEQHAKATILLADLAINRSALEFCEVLRAIDKADPGPDPGITESLKGIQTTEAETTAKVKRLAKRCPKGKAATALAAQVKEQRAAWLRDTYIPQLEAEHAQHGVLADLAKEAKEDPEPHLVAQLSLDAHHAAALAELSTLE